MNGLTLPLTASCATMSVCLSAPPALHSPTELTTHINAMTTRLYLRLYVHLSSSSSSWLILTLYPSLPLSFPACLPTNLPPSFPTYLSTYLSCIPSLTLFPPIPSLSLLACQPTYTYIPFLLSFLFLNLSLPLSILFPPLSFSLIFSHTLSFLFPLPHSCTPCTPSLSLPLSLYPLLSSIFFLSSLAHILATFTASLLSPPRPSPFLPPCTLHSPTPILPNSIFFPPSLPLFLHPIPLSHHYKFFVLAVPLLCHHLPRSTRSSPAHLILFYLLYLPTCPLHIHTDVRAHIHTVL